MVKVNSMLDLDSSKRYLSSFRRLWHFVLGNWGAINQGEDFEVNLIVCSINSDRYKITEQEELHKQNHNNSQAERKLKQS